MIKRVETGTDENSAQDKLQQLIAGQLAGALQRRDEQPNIDLAVSLAATATKQQIAALCALTQKGPKAQRHDAIKAFYEFAERKPDMAKPHFEQMLNLLSGRDNRMIWGAMSALAAIASTAPDLCAKNLNQILDAADRSSVIAKDKAMALLARVNAHVKFAPTVTPVIFQRLRFAAVNQTPMYVELAAPTISRKDWPEFATIVQKRCDEISFPAKKKRLQKVLDRGPEN